MTGECCNSSQTHETTSDQHDNKARQGTERDEAPPDAGSHDHRGAVENKGRQVFHTFLPLIASISGCSITFLLAPVASIIFNTSLGLSSFLMMGLLPTRFSSLFWLRKGAVLTSLIALFWYQQARQVSGLSDNGFFCLLSSFAPVPAELWVSLAFAVIAGAQAALAVLTLVSAVPLKRKD